MTISADTERQGLQPEATTPAEALRHFDGSALVLGPTDLPGWMESNATRVSSSVSECGLLKKKKKTTARRNRMTAWLKMLPNQIPHQPNSLILPLPFRLGYVEFRRKTQTSPRGRGSAYFPALLISGHLLRRRSGFSAFLLL